MKSAAWYADSLNLMITILCLKACKLIIKVCSVNMKILEQVSVLTDQCLAFCNLIGILNWIQQ